MSNRHIRLISRGQRFLLYFHILVFFVLCKANPVLSEEQALLSKELSDSFIQFDIKVISPPEDEFAKWLFKVESFQKIQVVEMPLESDITYEAAPQVGEWRTYRFDLLSISRFFPGINLEAIDKVLIFPEWGAGKGAKYRIDNLIIGNKGSTLNHVIFDGTENPDWPAWDCCGRSTPRLLQDEDTSKGLVMEFEVANENRGTVLGFTTHVATKPKSVNISFLLQNSGSEAIQGATIIREDSFSGIHFSQIVSEKINSIGAIYSIVKADNGFMWFGGSDGLARYDGYDLKIFKNDKANPNSLSNNTVWDIHIDSRGRFWVATDHGLNLFDEATETFQQFLHDPEDPNSLSYNIVKKLYEDSDNNLWIGTYGGLNLLKTDDGHFIRYESKPNEVGSLSNEIINAITEDKGGVLWVATDRGLNRFDKEKGQFSAYFSYWGDFSSLDNERVRSIHEDSLGRLWVGTYTGLNLLDRPSGKVTRFTFENEDFVDIGKLVSDEQNRLWIGTGDALIIFDPSTLSYTRYFDGASDSGSFQGKFPASIYKDEGDNWWLGTFPDGINYVEKNKNLFTSYYSQSGKPNSLTNDSVLTIEEDNDGNLWLGTDGGGLNYLDRKSGLFSFIDNDPNIHDSFQGKGVLSATLDSDNQLWIGLWEETMRVLDPSSDSFVHETPSREGLKVPESPIIWSSYNDSNGNMWFGTINNALFMYSPRQNQYFHFEPREDSPDSFGSLFVWSIFEDRNGRLWFGTNDGLELYQNKGNLFQSFQFDANDSNSLSNNNVLAINQDNEGHLWIGTRGGGLNKFDKVTQQFTHFTTEDGLPDDIVTAILVDEQGYLWLSTYNGLCRFDTKNNQCVNYSNIGGLRTNKFNIGSAKKLRTGELVFGGTGGFTIFDPQDLQVNNRVPPIVLTDFQIANRSISANESDSPLQQDISHTRKIVLDHTQSMFSFEFSALDFQNPAKNQYAYLLEGYDENWNEIGNRRRATYTNLDPGKYVFRVKGANSEGIWNESGASVELTLLPPPWQTWWAYSIYVFVVLVITALIVHLQIKKLQERRQLKLALWASGDEMWDVDLESKHVFRQNHLKLLYRDSYDSWLYSGIENSNIHPEDKLKVKHSIREQFESGQDYFEVSYRAKTISGAWVWFQDRGKITLRNASGEPVRVSGTTKNIDKLKSAESELKSLNRELELRVEERTEELKKSNEYLQNTQDKLVESEKMASLGTVVVGVSHELNTPVGNAITALSHLNYHLEQIFELQDTGKLTKSFFNKFKEDSLFSLQLANSSLSKSVNIIDSFKKISVVQSSSEMKTMDLRELLELAVSRIQPNGEQSNESVISIHCQRGLVIKTYSDVLESIVEQLIENAQQHAYSSNSPLHIDIHAEALKEGIFISVKDDGKGMSEEDVAQVFDPFFTTDRSYGIGLGMFVVYNQIHHLFDGTIVCESGAEEGTCFNIMLPYKASPYKEVGSQLQSKTG